MIVAFIEVLVYAYMVAKKSRKGSILNRRSFCSIVKAQLRKTAGFGNNINNSEFYSPPPGTSPINEGNGAISSPSPDLYKRSYNNSSVDSPNGGAIDVVKRASSGRGHGFGGKSNGHRHQILDSPQAQALLRHGGDGLDRDNPQL